MRDSCSAVSEDGVAPASQLAELRGHPRQDLQLTRRTVVSLPFVSVTAFKRVACLETLLNRQDLHHRLINGSDYPSDTTPDDRIREHAPHVTFTTHRDAPDVADVLSSFLSFFCFSSSVSVSPPCLW
jgi:hypothetical protein